MYIYQQIYVYGSTTEVDQTVIKRLPDCAFIPNDPNNTDWQAYLKWLEEGNTPLPADEVTQ